MAKRLLLLQWRTFAYFVFFFYTTGYVVCMSTLYALQTNRLTQSCGCMLKLFETAALSSCRSISLVSLHLQQETHEIALLILGYLSLVRTYSSCSETHASQRASLWAGQMPFLGSGSLLCLVCICLQFASEVLMLQALGGKT